MLISHTFCSTLRVPLCVPVLTVRRTQDCGLTAGPGDLGTWEIGRVLVFVFVLREGGVSRAHGRRPHQNTEGPGASGPQIRTPRCPENPTGNGDVTRIRNCETLRNGCESLRRHHWAVCEAARSRRESAAKPAKAPRKPRKRRESAAKKLRIRVTSPLPVGFFCTFEDRLLEVALLVLMAQRVYKAAEKKTQSTECAKCLSFSCYGQQDKSVIL